MNWLAEPSAAVNRTGRSHASQDLAGGIHHRF
jgi:hypothetical protein